MEISEKLKLLRLESGYSQSQIAKELFVSFQAISNWETAKTYPDIRNLIKLSDFYGVSLDELIKEDEQLKKKLQTNTSNNWKTIGYTSVLLLGILFLIGSLYIYFVKNEFLWYLFTVSIFLIIDGILSLKKVIYS
ncbi:TPA: helix-turn-helix transcriptional regulator [Clostridioides difficile]|nr:helix-turn-helix transcriptional regulator [Clostridioides difficile]